MQKLVSQMILMLHGEDLFVIKCLIPTVGFECDELESLENGAVSKPSNSVGSVGYSCEPGFMISGPRERVCQLSAASWSKSTPSCDGNAMKINLCCIERVGIDPRS